MTTTIPILSSPNPSILRPKFTSFSPLTSRLHNHSIPFRPATKIQSLSSNQTHNFDWFSGKAFGFLFERRLRVRVSVKEDGVDEAEEESRGESTMPKRFRYLAKEAPDPPVRWPWFVALAFLIYAWRAVLLELSNWKKGALAIIQFVGYLLKLSLAIIFHFIGDPITYTIRFVETLLYAVRSFYSGIVAYTPISDLTTVIMLASAVLAIAEAVVPNSANCQPILLTFSGILGYAVVFNYISEPFFYTILVGLYGYSRFVKRRDDVTSTLPCAAVLAAVGEPWIRVLVIPLFLALAIFQNWKKLPESKEDVIVTNRKLPFPLLAAALAIGIRLAAKWAGYRHLTWKIV
ncbi:uncharacterized protein LOC126799490 [Argentina anserina]|uniref:uncharacterized protein LOC126799490 n=1 Tax=Argentina anserina TaxID=57926 RepID=UPI0021766E34|nr:uncharacterized protein LOC126799490 [Potentilla anserina]